MYAERESPPGRVVLDRRVEAVRSRPFPFLLETALDVGGGPAVSLVGADPCAVLLARGRSVEFWESGEVTRSEASPFDALRSLLGRFADEERDRGPVHVVGYLGYDLCRHLERVPSRALDDQAFPDLMLGFYDRLTMIDATTGAERIIAGRGHRRAMSREIYRSQFTAPCGRPGSNFDRGAYLDAVAAVREHIRAGDIYQVNLSQRFAARFDSDALALYRRLRQASPAPYAAWLELGDRAVVSSSPEEFVRLDGSVALTRPIKGTRPRGSSADEDRRLRQALLASAKDDAELVMIVDLERNDLGRIAEPGSVSVPVRKTIEAHPTVWHLSASVRARLRPGNGPVELLEATFPGGSVTGAPKIRAMEIIDALEPTRRSVFTGAIVWMRPRDFLRSSVAIRTMQVHGEHVTFQVGGAIVWDSDPEEEYRETLVKARGMARALGIELERGG
jgi:para-aminobenzoate synthetase component 1